MSSFAGLLVYLKALACMNAHLLFRSFIKAKFKMMLILSSDL